MSKHARKKSFPSGLTSGAELLTSLAIATEDPYEIPEFLKVDTPEKVAARKATWEKNPPKPMAFLPPPVKATDPEVAAFKAQQEAQAKARASNRIAKMKARFEQNKVNMDTHKWDPSICKFVPRDKPVAKTDVSSTPMEDDMAKAKAKKTKTKITKKGPKEVGVKRAAVMKMLGNGGATIPKIQKELRITEAAARSLIGDIQRASKLDRTKNKDGISVYRLA